MTRIILSGCNGKMGQAIVKAVADREDAVISAGVDIFTDCGYDFPVFNDFKKIDTEADVIIDFSNPVVLDGLLSHARGKSFRPSSVQPAILPRRYSRLRRRQRRLPCSIPAICRSALT